MFGGQQDWPPAVYTWMIGAYIVVVLVCVFLWWRRKDRGDE
jgi:membrane protein DedA with SNARE-associated domain